MICYEDSPLARWWHPAITVIDNKARQMGELAARLLLERLAAAPGEREEFSEFRVGTRLIERDSCRAVRVRDLPASMLAGAGSARVGIEGG